MAENRKKIVLEGQDAGVSSMMQRLKNDSKELSRGLLQDARNYSMSGKDSLRYLEDQIKSIERRNKLELEGKRLVEEKRYANKLASATTDIGRKEAEGEYRGRLASIGASSREDEMQIRLLRDIAENIKEIAKDEVLSDPNKVQKAIRQAERRNFAGIDEEEAAKLKYQKDLMQKEGVSGSPSVFSQFLGAQVLRDAGAIIQQMPTAQSGLDLVSPVAGLAGMASGGLVGAGVGALAGSLNTGISGTAAGRGAIEGLAVGSEIGKQVGQFAGAALTRSLQEQEKYQTGAFGVENITGVRPNTPRLSRFGISAADGIGMQEGVVRAAGRAITSQEMTDLIAVRARGITQETATGFFGMERTGGGNASNELSRLIGVLEEIPTINRAIYNDIADSQLSLMGSMRGIRDSVSSEEALKTVLAFNSLGGQFGAKNPMANQNIQNTMSSMANPANDYVRARQFSLLKEANPGADFYELEEMMQNPTPEMMQLFLSDKGMGSASEGMKNRMIGSAYANGNIAMGRRLRGGMSIPNTSSMTNMGAIANEAASRTPEFARQSATIDDAFLSDPISGITQVGKEFGNTMDMIIDKEMKRLDIEGQITEKFGKAVEKFEAAAAALTTYLSTKLGQMFNSRTGD